MINDLERFSVERLEGLISDAETWSSVSIPSNQLAALARIALAAKRRAIIVNFGESTKEEIDTLISRINSEKGMPFIHADKQDKPVIPGGWKLVPVEPSLKMMEAAVTCEDASFDDDSDMISIHHEVIYKAMLAAAPAPEEL
ncbi:hypothetical protein [Rouxiella sp. Mn2063]|uniref:hypothetical protein n=1 Tax=Rouxiella sp. Mn2063 TaxID=3395262 RepID=UPI003BCC42EA